MSLSRRGFLKAASSAVAVVAVEAFPLHAALPTATGLNPSTTIYAKLVRGFDRLNIQCSLSHWSSVGPIHLADGFELAYLDIVSSSCHRTAIRGASETAGA